MCGESASLKIDFTEMSSERLEDEEKMYQEIYTYALCHGLSQTITVLPYAKKMHEGQYRKGREKIPYIYHPLFVARHAIALGFAEDNLLSAALLHDVCEDCNVLVENLPVNAETKQAVAILTKSKEQKMEQYYEAIAQNRIAVIVKLLDRCNNISSMGAAFSIKKKRSYIKETETYVLPLLQIAEQRYAENRNQIFLIRYHMRSVITNLNDLLSSPEKMEEI